MEELPIYKEDWIGLAALNSQEKLNKVEIMHWEGSLHW